MYSHFSSVSFHGDFASLNNKAQKNVDGITSPSSILAPTEKMPVEEGNSPKQERLIQSRELSIDYSNPSLKYPEALFCLLTDQLAYRFGSCTILFENRVGMSRRVRLLRPSAIEPQHHVEEHRAPCIGEQQCRYPYESINP